MHPINRFLFCACLCSAVTAADHYVTVDGNGDGSSWQEASGDLAAIVGASTAGDAVHVGPGTFTVDDDLLIPSGVSLIGRGPDGDERTVITGSWSAGGGFPPSNSVLRLKNAENVTIRDLAIDGQEDQLPGGIYAIDCAHVLIRNVHVLDTNFVGIWLHGGSHYEIDGSYLYNCGHENNSYSSGLLSLGGISDSRIHHTRIYGHDDNDGYGVKSMGGGNSLTRVEFDHLDIDVKPRAMWNGGSSNFSMELAHSSFAEEVRIHDCTFNMGLSLVGHDEYTGDSYSFDIYHNYLDVTAGRWIELTTSRMRIHHNYFTGAHSGHPCFNNYAADGDLGDIVIHHNILEYANGNLFGLQGANGITFANNTVIWTPHQDSRKIPYLAKLQHDNSDHSWIVKNNLFLSPDDRTGELFRLGDDGIVPDVDADRNYAPYFTIADNSAPSGDPLLPLDGAKPAPWWRPGDGSPLIDAGVPVAGCTDDAVDAPDIGAFEHGDDNRFLPDDFTWPVLAPSFVRVQPGLDYAIYDFADDSSSMLDDIRDALTLTPDATGHDAAYDNLLVKDVDPEGNYIGIVFTGYIQAPREGLYRFWLSSEDGSRLQIDGQDILENDGWHSEQTVSDVVRLQQGLHQIRIFYASWWGRPQAIELRWQPPGDDARAITAADLFRLDPDASSRAIELYLSGTMAWTAAIPGRPPQTAQPGGWVNFPALDPSQDTPITLSTVAPSGDG